MPWTIGSIDGEMSTLYALLPNTGVQGQGSLISRVSI